MSRMIQYNLIRQGTPRPLGSGEFDTGLEIVGIGTGCTEAKAKEAAKAKLASYKQSHPLEKVWIERSRANRP